MKKENQNEKSFEKALVERDKGLNVNYDKNELDEFLPHLMEEITSRKKSISIDSVDYEVEQQESANNEEKEKEEVCIDDLRNPKAIDFIRRCSKKEQAIEILDYLLKREEISKEDYNQYLKVIDQENGLRILIEKTGGFKKPGYYLRKYYNKNFNKEQNLKSNEN